MTTHAPKTDTQDICIEFQDVVAGYKDFMILNTYPDWPALLPLQKKY